MTLDLFFTVPLLACTFYKVMEYLFFGIFNMVEK